MGKEDSEGFFAFVPARIANRQQLQAMLMNEQQTSSIPNLSENEQNTPELQNQSLPLVDSNQTRPDSLAKAKQWPGQSPWAPPSSGVPSIDSNFGQSQMRPINQQQPTFSQQNQGFGSQSWLNQVPNTNPQNNQQFAGQTPSWQGLHTVQNQPQFPNQNQQAFQTSMPSQSVTHLQGFQNPQDQSWSNIPNTQVPSTQLPQSVGFNQQGTQNFGTQQPTWQGSQTVQSQPWLQGQHQQSFFETSTSAQNVLFSQGLQNPNLPGQSWHNVPNTQLPGAQLPQSVVSNPQGTQNFGTQSQPWQNTQTAQSQPWLQGGQVPQSSGFNTQQTPGFGSQPQPWKSAKPTQQDQQFSSNIPSGISTDNKNRLNTGMQKPKQFGLEQQKVVQNQQPWKNQENNQIRQKFIQPEAPLIDDQQVPLNNEQSFTNQPTKNQPWLQTFNSKSSSTGLNQDQLQKGVQPQQQQQDQTFGTQQWLNQVSDINTQNNKRLVTQPVQDQSIKSQSNQISFQPVPWPGTSKLNRPSLTTDSSADTQSGFNQKQNLPVPNLFDQKQSWSTNQQFPTQGSQPSDSDDLDLPTTQSFPTRPIVSSKSQTGLPMQDVRGWQPIRTVEKSQLDNNQIKSTIEQRKPLDSISTLSSGSWKSRSS